MYKLPDRQILSTAHAKYEIAGRLGEGGRGETYLARVVDVVPHPPANIRPPGTRVVIKMAKIDEARGIEEVRKFLNFVDTRLMEEARALTKLDHLGCVAHFVDTGTHQVRLRGRELVHPRFLVQEFIEGKILLDHFGKRFKGLKTAKEWFDLSGALVEVLLQVHQTAVVHNDVWYKNIMINKAGEPVLIDFGEAVFRNARFVYIDPNVRNDPWMAPEWLNIPLRPSRRTDLFGLGGVFFWLACGANPPMPRHDIEQAKLDIAKVIAKRNPRLLAENIGIADIIARCRRFDRALRISTAEKLRRELLTFSRRVPPAQPRDTAKRIVMQARSLSGGGNIFLDRMADMLLREAERQLEDMHYGILVISGKHEDLVTGCIDALASLKRNDEYLAVSTLKFWKPENIGIRGRFLSMTQLCAQRGVRIRRLFLLTASDLKDPLFWPIMRAQMELENRQTAPFLETRFQLLSKDEYEERLERGDHCGHWISRGQVMEVVPFYDLNDLLRSVHLIERDISPARVRIDFNHQFEKAEQLTRRALQRHKRKRR